MKQVKVNDNQPPKQEVDPKKRDSQPKKKEFEVRKRESVCKESVGLAGFGKYHVVSRKIRLPKVRQSYIKREYVLTFGV